MLEQSRDGDHSLLWKALNDVAVPASLLGILPLFAQPENQTTKAQDNYAQIEWKKNRHEEILESPLNKFPQWSDDVLKVHNSDLL